MGNYCGLASFCEILLGLVDFLRDVVSFSELSKICYSALMCIIALALSDHRLRWLLKYLLAKINFETQSIAKFLFGWNV